MMSSGLIDATSKDGRGGAFCPRSEAKVSNAAITALRMKLILDQPHSRLGVNRGTMASCTVATPHC